MKRILVMLCAFAMVVNADAQDDCMNPDVNCDGFVNVNDLLGLLGYFGDEDLDGDGIWDSQDDCVLDICDVCNGDGVDVDGDGICDEWDDCVGELDDCGVCNGNGPEVLAVDTITFTTDSVFIEALNDWYVFEIPDTTFTLVCTNPGCMDPLAENYNPYASEDDGSCEFLNGEPACNYESSLNFNGYDYQLIAIGEQCWFAENLRTELYANGDSIPELVPFNGLDISYGAQNIYGNGLDSCYYEPCDIGQNLSIYGRLYNGFAVNDERGLCPQGFHVPTDDDFISLESFLGMPDEDLYSWSSRGTNEGSMMKAVLPELTYWQGTNESGFNGMPGGWLTAYGLPMNALQNARWWTSSPSPFLPNDENIVRRLSDHSVGGQSSSGGMIIRDKYWHHYGFSVRCLKDTE